MKVAVLYGQALENASKDEQDTLVQVDTISQSLARLGYYVIPVPLSLDVQDALSELRFISPEIVFNLVESIEGQGRLIHLGPALLDTLRLPYTGAKTDAIFLTSNKPLAKRFLRNAGIPTPDWFSLQDLKNGISLNHGRYIIKSVWEHASIGLSEDAVIDTDQKTELRKKLEQHQPQLGHEGFVEAYIDGREFNLSLLIGEDGPEVLPPAEIQFDAYPEGKLKIVDYPAKWDEDSFEYAHTPRRFYFRENDKPLLQQLRNLAIACWQLFGLKGYARVDFRVDEDGSPWILEVNANPCLSPDAGFMAAARQAGIHIDEVLERILRDV
jgi:D-alanine-D-alanine ligase